MALKFGAPEYFSLMLMGLVAAVVLAHGAMIKSLAMVVLGLLLGIVGTDVNSGMARFSFGYAGVDRRHRLRRGRGGRVRRWARSSATSATRQTAQVFTARSTSLMPTWEDFKARVLARSCAARRIGAFLGILPGTGPAIAVVRRLHGREEVSQDPSRFGKGAIEGVAAPEAANNAGAQSSSSRC